MAGDGGDGAVHELELNLMGRFFSHSDFKYIDIGCLRWENGILLVYV